MLLISTSIWLNLFRIVLRVVSTWVLFVMSRVKSWVVRFLFLSWVRVVLVLLLSISKMYVVVSCVVRR